MSAVAQSPRSPSRHLSPAVPKTAGLFRHDYKLLRTRRQRVFQCRCRSCEARVTLKLHPESYRRRLACWSCGRTSKHRSDVWRIDWFRTSGKESKRRGVCHCDAAPFPHRPGHGLRHQGGGNTMQVTAC